MEKAKKVKAAELRSYEPARLREMETDIRRQLVGIRMDIYSPVAQQSATVRSLRRTLARILTVGKEKGSKARVATKTAKKKK